jgi:hypothetical protein
MSFSEYEDCFEWRCEGCGLTAEFAREGAGSFMSAVGELKSRGWLIERGSEYGEWHHHCAKCRRERGAKLLEMPFGKVGRG